MSASTEHLSPLHRRLTGAAIAAIVTGVVIVILGVGFGWSGVGGGFALGAGVGLAGVGAYLWGYANGMRRPATRAGWLPSRDGRE